ncbi:hypothetical protein F9K33_02645 [bacterium]|nr:MAG: hypothetical protein F9K33_02645 [bacterium]
MIFSIFARSLKITLQQKKMMGLLWALSIIFAFPVFWTLHRSLNSFFGGRQVASEWLHQFNISYLLEMINDFPTIIPTTNALFFGSALLFLLVTIFLTGGIIGKLIQTVSENSSDQESFLTSFFGFSGKFFFRIFRVFLWTLLLSLVSFAFMMIGGYAVLITAALIAVWIMTSDITKIRLISENSGAVTKTYFSSFIWVMKNVPSVALVYLINFIMLVLAFALYKLADNALIANGILKIFLIVIIHQMFVFFRGAIRIQMFSSAIFLWNAKWKAASVVSNPSENLLDEQTQSA